MVWADFRKSCFAVVVFRFACMMRETEHTTCVPHRRTNDDGDYNNLVILTLARDGLGRSLLGQQHGMNVGKDTTTSDGDATEQLVQLLVVLDGKSKVTGHDTSLLVIPSGIAGELQDLGAEVLEDGGEVDGSAGTHAGGVFALTEVTADTADGELKSGLG